MKHLPRPERRVDELGLSVRSLNCLINGNITYDLMQKSETEILDIPNLGRKSLKEIKDALAQLGLRLGMEVNGHWYPLYHY
jgi:DNA-directed RNA polymerase subunit alpha